ncbi:MAG: hypothetical protein K5770_05950, partial [Lachnospiraceae bacterium]|nr:hypothetical protein [Lachnospiraceae bacterium]
AKSDGSKREEFIRDNEQTILKIASKATGRFITRSDDEWSVALSAFNKAIDNYEPSKGDFAGFAGVVIDRALIDHFRSEKKYEAEISYSPEMLTGEGDYEEHSEVLKAVTRESTQTLEMDNTQRSLKDEILEVNDKLQKYGFTFRNLKGCSPKAGKTKRECAKAITHIMDNHKVREAVIETGRLPAKEIIDETKVSAKLLDRYRRYIIMAVIILNGEYPLLADYLEYVRKDAGGP